MLKGYRRCVITAGSALRINEWARREEAGYGGKFVLPTNTRLPRAEVLAAYKQESHIERAFRTVKSHLDLRPLFHWTESPHSGACHRLYLAIVLGDTLQRLLRDAGVTALTRTLFADLEQGEIPAT